MKGLLLGGDLTKVLRQKVYLKFHKQDAAEVFQNHILMQNEMAVSLSNSDITEANITLTVLTKTYQ